MLNSYVCVDIETSGIRVKWDKIIEIGAVKVQDGKIVDVFSELINPGVKVAPYITKLTGITNEMLEGKPDISQVLPRFIEFVGEYPLMGHNVMFDYSFLKQNASNFKIPFEKNGIDTLKIARKVLPELESRALDFLCTYFGISDEQHHRAFNDAKATVDLYEILVEKFEKEKPEIFEPYQFQYAVKKLSPITEKQKKYLTDLNKKYNIEPDYDINKLSKSEASRKIDKILSENGRIFD